MEQPIEVHMNYRNHSESESSHSPPSSSHSSQEATTCQICCEVRDELLAISSQCEHLVCAQCVSGIMGVMCYIGGGFDIQCPYDCGATIDWPVLEQCGTEKQLKFLIANNVNHAFYWKKEHQYWCPLCDTAFISRNLRKCPEFQCPNCSKWACYKCRDEVPPDTNHECDKSDSSTIVPLPGFAICRRCEIPIVNDGGCDLMTCPCGEEYSWRYETHRKLPYFAACLLFLLIGPYYFNSLPLLSWLASLANPRNEPI